MGWVGDDQRQKKDKKPVWDYKDGVRVMTVLPNTTRNVIILTGDMDPTGTWTTAIPVWIHEFKTANGFASIVCNKWNEACPFCFENEIYKSQNPNYKAVGGRLPYGIARKALVQVWDLQEKDVIWMIAGKHIQEGMDFILTKFNAQYKNAISITRMGESLSTSYRVDLYPDNNLDDFARNTIKAKMVPLQNAASLFYMNRGEIFKKTGIDSAAYFKAKQPQFPAIDISGWGPVPRDGDVPQNVPPTQQNSVQLAPELLGALDIQCTMGVFAGSPLKKVVQQAGLPYIQFLMNSGTDVEKQAGKLLYDNWDQVQQYLIGGMAF